MNVNTNGDTCRNP